MALLTLRYSSAYSTYGFYVLEGALSPEEVSDLEHDLNEMRDNFPTEMGATVDAKGRPALGVGCKGMVLQWAKPLSDPLGGTALLNGRHQVKLFEPQAKQGSPQATPLYLGGSLQFSKACLRTYAHPGLLKLAEAINGQDFTPFMRGSLLKTRVLVPQYLGIKMVTPIGTALILMKIATALILWAKSTVAPRLTVSG